MDKDASAWVTMHRGGRVRGLRYTEKRRALRTSECGFSQGEKKRRKEKNSERVAGCNCLIGDGSFQTVHTCKTKMIHPRFAATAQFRS